MGILEMGGKMKTKLNRKDTARFWKKVDKSGNCWLWKAYIKTNGYGQFQIEKKPYLAHRISWIIHNGDIPNGLQVLHKCDVRNCVNPNHLWLGTQGDNVRDMEKKNRGVHPTGEEHGRSKLKEFEVRQIKTALKTPYHGIVNDLAFKYGVDASHISKIKSKVSWKHIS